jgi:probable rRNA maturation factor
VKPVDPEDPDPMRRGDDMVAASLGTEFIFQDERWETLDDFRTIESCAQQALLLLSGTATVALSDDATVAGLNGQFRDKPQPTNVLAFPSPPAQQRAGAWGDVILAYETVVREAGELGIPVAHHAGHLVVHGILHLAGYDHDTDVKATAMEAIETRLLATIGIADPYSDPAETALKA